MTISQYESGSRKPDIDTIKDLCNLFNVSSDYLLGINNVRNPYEEKSNSLSDNDVIAAHSDKKTVKLTKEDLLEIEDFLNKRRNKKK